jgi:hypothetical protein
MAESAVRRGRFSVGFVLGGAVATVVLLTDAARDEAREHRGQHEWHCQCSLPMPFYESYLLWLSVAILVVGYAAAVVLAVRHTTRRLGVGLLVGITLLLPVGAFVLLLFTWGEGGG